MNEKLKGNCICQITVFVELIVILVNLKQSKVAWVVKLIRELVDKSYNLILKGFSKKRQQEILNS